ncbi:HAD family hydrolase [Lewinella sp. IMCC34183]|uniref:HAD family hydrolase n=1 Tax=Lewinella sp. IMCC34183 TaxID=2248762 RepID=UPI000E27B5EE|nr:HAD family hydrolase [Lewinella sp. IMCC34183]
MTKPVKALFLDIGGVMLSNGWETSYRQRAAGHFGLDFHRMEALHHPIAAVLETGHITLDEYLDLVVFHQERPFTKAEFRDFMFSMSTPYPAVIDLFRGLKEQYALKVFVVSNESRELNAYRIHQFGLVEWIDCFVSSCYVGYQKPDPNIFKLALDLVQVPAEETLFIDNTDLHIRAAARQRIPGVVHRDLDTTRRELKGHGLEL